MVPLQRRRDEPPPGAVGYWDFTRDLGSKVLDLSGRNSDFPNLVLSPAMNVDSNADGVVNDFTSVTLAGVTATYQLDDNAQRINITGGTAVDSASVQQDISCAAGQILTFGVTGRISGNVTIEIQVDWYNGATYLSSNTGTSFVSTTYALTHMTATAPTSTTLVKIKCRVKPNAIGNTGSAWFKNAKVIRHSTFNTPDKSTYLYGGVRRPLGLQFDGVDDYCTIENNNDLDITTATPDRPLVLSACIRPDLVDGTVRYILSKNGSSSTDRQYALVCYNNEIYVILNGTGKARFPYTVGQWIDVVFVWNGSNSYGFRNGVQTGTTYTATDTLVSMPNIRMGCFMNGSSTSNFFQGIINDVMVSRSPDIKGLIEWRKKYIYPKVGIPA